MSSETNSYDDAAALANQAIEKARNGSKSVHLRDSDGLSDNEDMKGSSPRPKLDAKLDVLRADIRASHAEMRADMAKMSGGLLEKMSSVRENVAEMRGEMNGAMKSIQTTQWVLGFIIGFAALLVAGVQLFAGDSSQDARQPPAVIYMSPPPPAHAVQTPYQSSAPSQAHQQ